MANRRFIKICFWITLLISSIANFTTKPAYAADCISSNDLGYGNSDIKVKTRQTEQELLRSGNQNPQVSRWQDLGVYTLGSAVDQYGQSGYYIAGSIQGKWYPWGQAKDKNQTCTIKKCDNPGSSSVVYGNCITPSNTGGKITTSGSLIDPKGNAGCYLENGIGLYGLIAIQQSDGTYPDPNLSANIAESPPQQLFRSFHFGPHTDQNGNFAIKNIFGCIPSGSNNYICDNNTSTILGKVYVKVMNSYYLNNYGEYYISIVSGVYSTGFISQVMSFIADTLLSVSATIREQVVKNVHDYIKPLLYLYIIFFTLAFAMGLMQTTQAEFIKAFFKIGLLVTLMQDSNLKIINDTLFKLFDVVPNEISAILARAAMLYKTDPNMTSGSGINAGSLPAGAGYLVLYDAIFGSLTSSAIQNKIWSLLFTTKFYYIFLLYFALFAYIMIILKMLMNYLGAFFKIAMLGIIFPIMLLLILFKNTGNFFQNWIKHTVSAAVSIILTTAFMTMMFLLLDGAFTSLFGYEICTAKNWYTFYISYYQPTNRQALDTALDGNTYLYCLLLLMLFHNAIDLVNGISDGMTGTPIGGASAFYGAGMGAATNLWHNSYQYVSSSWVGKGLGTLRDKYAMNYNIGKVVFGTRGGNTALSYIHKGLEKAGKGYRFASTIFDKNHQFDPFGLDAAKRKEDQEKAKTAKENERRKEELTEKEQNSMDKYLTSNRTEELLAKTSAALTYAAMQGPRPLLSNIKDEIKRLEDEIKNLSERSDGQSILINTKKEDLKTLEMQRDIDSMRPQDRAKFIEKLEEAQTTLNNLDQSYSEMRTVISREAEAKKYHEDRIFKAERDNEIVEKKGEITVAEGLIQRNNPPADSPERERLQNLKKELNDLQILSQDKLNQEKNILREQIDLLNIDAQKQQENCDKLLKAFRR